MYLQIKCFGSNTHTICSLTDNKNFFRIMWYVTTKEITNFVFQNNDMIIR